MDHIYKLILLFLFPCAVLAMPTVGVISVRGATSTVYSVYPSAGTSPLLTQPVGSTLINSGIAAASNGYTSNALLSGSVKSAPINWGVTAASLALSATKFAANPFVMGGVIAGTAIYNYMQQSGITANPSTGDFMQGPIIGTSYPNISGCPNPKVDTFDFYSPSGSGYTRAYLQSGSCSPGGSNTNNCLNVASTAFLKLCVQTLGVVLPASTAITTAAAITALTNNPPADKTATIAQLHNPDNDKYYKLGILTDPDADAPTVTAPATSLDPQRTVVNPDNSVSQISDSTTCTQTTATSTTCTTTTTTKNTPVSGTPTTTTTANAPPDTPLTPVQSTSKSDCELIPDAIGCSKYGTPSAPDVITTTNIPSSLSPTSLGSGTCPAPKVMSLSKGLSVTMSYQPYCDFATMSAPLTIAFAWLSAGFLVLGSVRDN